MRYFIAYFKLKGGYFFNHIPIENERKSLSYFTNKLVMGVLHIASSPVQGCWYVKRINAWLINSYSICIQCSLRKEKKHVKWGFYSSINHVLFTVQENFVAHPCITVAQVHDSCTGIICSRVSSSTRTSFTMYYNCHHWKSIRMHFFGCIGRSIG